MYLELDCKNVQIRPRGGDGSMIGVLLEDIEESDIICNYDKLLEVIGKDICIEYFELKEVDE